MTKDKLSNDQTEFVLPDGTVNFLRIHAGQAKAGKESIHRSYSLEWSGDLTQESQIVQCVMNVAKFYDPTNWQRHIWAPYGALLRLNEKAEATGRDVSLYSYADGKFVVGLSKVISLKMAGMEGANLSDPVVREKYDRFVDSQPPKVSRFADPNNPFDIQLIEEENRKRVLHNLTPYKESDYYKVLLPCRVEDIWGGCVGKVCGRAYWSDIRKKVHFALEQVLLVRQGPRLQGADKSPDEVFGAFAPTAAMAPPSAPPPPPVNAGWNLQ